MGHPHDKSKNLSLIVKPIAHRRALSSFVVSVLMNERLGNSSIILLLKYRGATPVLRRSPSFEVLPPYSLGPDHAPREAFSQVFCAEARHRSDRLIGLSALAMQRVWG